MNQVQPQYVLKQEYAQNRVDLIGSIFASAITVLDEIEQMRKEAMKNAEKGESVPFREPTLSEKVERLKGKLTAEVVNELSGSTLSALVSSSKSDLEMARDAAVTAVNNTMTQRISASQVENAKKKAEEEIRYITLPSDLKQATIELARFAIVQNEFYDPEATEELRKKAAENVEPVQILQGQIIVEEGQLISTEVYRQLEILGLLKSETSFFPMVGLLLYVLLLCWVIHQHFRRTEDESQRKSLFMFCLVLILSVVTMKAISFLDWGSVDECYIFPAAMAAILLKMLVDDRTAMIGLILTAANGTLIFNGNTSGTFHLVAGLYILFSGLASILFLKNRNERSKIFQAGLFVSVVNIAFIGAVLFIPNSKLSYLQYTAYLLSGLGSGVGSAVLSIGILPFFEAGFGVLSSMKLIELSNPNHPLLRKILTEAPGTYHHSVMVANLAETACEAIGANGLLARVGSYYHDIGKTKRPVFFVENQMHNENPHDRLDPVVSKDIIISHTKDGAEILERHRMPREIIDIARQHHGTTVVKYFYHRAKERGMDVSEEEFRYPGPKPQSKEAAVICIADSVEAAVRSMTNPSTEEIDEMVKSIINDKLSDLQFAECDMTFKELYIVEKTICETLYGIFHNRIKYPEFGEGEQT
jgi:uncharacterized domain HDIG